MRRPDRLSLAARQALRMCNWHAVRIKAGGHTLSTDELARKYQVSTRTIHRWVAIAKEQGVLRIERTGRRPFWRVNQEMIQTLRARSDATYGRRRDGRMAPESRNVRYGYREACFAYWLENHPSSDLTKTTPHTPNAFQHFMFSLPEPRIPPSSYSSLPYDPIMRARVRAQAEVEKREKAVSSMVSKANPAITRLALFLAMGAAPSTQRAATAMLTQSGIFTDTTGAPLRAATVRQAFGFKPRYRANGGDSERNATALQKYSGCRSGVHHG